MEKPYQAMTGISRKGAAFIVKVKPPVDPHLIHNGTGIPNCSVCGYPVNIQNVKCKTCQHCFVKF